MHSCFDTFHAGKSLTVTLHDLLALSNFLVQMPQIADAHSCLKFVHLGITAYKANRLRTMDTKILLVVQ